jgi:hypothetical protein
MVQGAQTNATGFVAFKLESTSGTPESAPQKVADPKANGYIVLRGDMAPVTKKAPKFNEVAGQAFPTLPVPGGESFEMSLPMFPILTGNGLGPLLACALGDDTMSILVASHAWEHVLTWSDLIKTFTTFCHYGTNDDDQYRMCAIDSIDIKSKGSDGAVEIDLKVQGASLEHLTSGAVETDEFIDPDSASQLTHAGLRVEIGQPSAAIRDLIDDMTISIKRNLGFGPLCKPGQHPAGSSSHNTVNSKKSNCELKLSFQDTDREEIQRAMYPVNTDPAAQTRYSDVVRYLKARFSWFGAMLYAGVNGEADYCNAGTLSIAFAGTYTGGDVVTVGQIQIKQGTPDEFRFRYTTGGAWSAWSEYAEITTGAGVALTGCLGIEATFSSTTAGADGDMFYFCSHYRELKRVTIPVMAYKDVPKTTFKDGMRKIEEEFAAVDTGVAADRPSITIWNAEGYAFDT